MKNTRNLPSSVLIESDWNLKYHLWCRHKRTPEGINRIRLEFKGVLFSWSTGHTIPVLIESDWNLKEYQSRFLPVLRSVLIESDWNLKQFRSDTISSSVGVLIESDWNLKKGCVIAKVLRSKRY